MSKTDKLAYEILQAVITEAKKRPGFENPYRTEEEMNAEVRYISDSLKNLTENHGWSLPNACAEVEGTLMNFLGI